MEEVWKDVPNYENYYQASNLGRIFSVKSNKILSTKVSEGYSRITLYKNKIKKGFLTHRLIMITFVGESDLQVDHINGIKTDNRLENLRYVDSRTNMKFMFERIKSATNCIGIRKDKNEGYNSRIWIEGKRYHIGRYPSKDEALEAYNNALFKYNTYGEKPSEKVYSSQYKGVRKVRDKYSSKITINKVNYNLGSYSSETEASQVYENALYRWKTFSELPSYKNPNKASKYEGIYFVKNAKYKQWKASVKIEDKRIYIGYFNTEEEAHQAQLNYLENESTESKRK